MCARPPDPTGCPPLLLLLVHMVSLLLKSRPEHPVHKLGRCTSTAATCRPQTLGDERLQGGQLLTWEGCLLKGGDGLGHALAIDVDLALVPVGCNLLVTAPPHGRVLLHGHNRSTHREHRAVMVVVCQWCVEADT